MGWLVWYTRCMRFSWLLFAALAYTIAAAPGQECPKPSETGPTVPSAVRTLTGQLIFHNDIRGWFELKLDKPQCGQGSNQLISLKSDGKALQVLRGCPVKSTGTLDLSPTGYYTLDVFQDVQSIHAEGECERKPPFTDYSKAKPDSAVRSYRVDMRVDYGPGDHPIVFHVTDSGKELRPWQAYASYYLTGGFVLYGHCGEGFVVDKVFGTPETNPQHFAEPRTPEDMAAFDPEGAAASGKRVLDLGYTCLRDLRENRR
jgi:hypothetical protein